MFEANKTTFNIIHKMFSLTLFGLLNVYNATGQTNRLKVSGGLAYEGTNLKWSIAGNQAGQSPNILSELSFRKISSLGAYVKAEYKVTGPFIISGSYQQSATIDGAGYDNDYQGDNRTSPKFSENFKSNQGGSSAVRVGAKFIFVQTTKFTVEAGVNYQNTNQTFHILNAGFENLNSTYTARSFGYEFLTNSSYFISNKLLAIGGLGYGSLAYRSYADWNLIEVFQHPISFRQEANGISFNGKLGLQYQLSPYLSLGLNGSYNKIKTDKGKDTSFLKNGNSLNTQFNGADWKTYIYKLEINYRF